MKLITAVIGKKDLNPVCDALREAGYSFTKIPTSGGFLRSSNMTPVSYTHLTLPATTSV